MSRVRGSLEIARPVDVVFDTVADQRNEPSFNPAMTESTKVTSGPIGAGTRFEAVVMSGGKPRKVTIDYTGFERPRRIDSTSVMAGATVRGHIRCDPAPAGTLFSWDWEVRLIGPARLARPLVAVIGRRQERAIWTGLKDHLESRSDPHDPR